MEKIYIIGIGMTKFGKHFDLSVKDLTRQAVEEALEDSGCQVGDVEAAYFANTGQGLYEGQHSIRGQVALRELGFEEIPVINVENACASGSTALNSAISFLKAGEGDIALAVGVEKMFTKEKEKNFEIFNSGWDVHTAQENQDIIMDLGRGIDIPKGSMSEEPYSLFMDVYAAFAKNHMKMFGTTQEQIAAISAKNHQNSVHNPLAQYQKHFTIEEILAAPPIAYPFTLPMCSPLSDGAAAVIVCTESAARKFQNGRKIEVLASVIQTGSTRDPEDVKRNLSSLAAEKAYIKAGIGPEDISVAEVHDATAIGEIIQVENLGFCKYGEGGPLALEGYFDLTGKKPVNTSGGLESKGHPIGATGLGQIHELVTQLREEAGDRQVEKAQFALAENGGGVYGIEESVCVLTILGR